jgi:hypothetical protein
VEVDLTILWVGGNFGGGGGNFDHSGNFGRRGYGGGDDDSGGSCGGDVNIMDLEVVEVLFKESPV